MKRVVKCATDIEHSGLSDNAKTELGETCERIFYQVNTDNCEDDLQLAMDDLNDGVRETILLAFEDGLASSELYKHAKSRTRAFLEYVNQYVIDHYDDYEWECE